MNNNYHPSITINEQEWTSYCPMDCATAYDEAVRMKTEYGAEKACIKVFTPDFTVVHSWKNGEYTRHKGVFLYAISI